MLLSTFIETHKIEILKEWDSFAAKLFGESTTPSKFLLRDHAAEILVEVILEMRRTETLRQKKEKSMSALLPAHLYETAGDIHGILRHEAGMSMSFLAAEFRALRASVLALWLPKIHSLNKTHVAEMLRFNAALDDALADSIATYELQRAA